jgi:hypothetical protein
VVLVIGHIEVFTVFSQHGRTFSGWVGFDLETDGAP